MFFYNRFLFDTRELIFTKLSNMTWSGPH